MIKTKMTEYVFEIRKTITVNVHGRNTEDTYEKAEEEVIQQVKKNIDDDWLECISEKEYTDYEKEKE